MSSSAPIGVFDSGLGGISVVRQIRAEMPHERILFFGDSAHAPYGTKTPQEVRALSRTIVEHLVEQGAKAIVIACNTATSAAVNELRDEYSLPIIGMEPALKVACDRGHGVPQRVVVAATPLTLREHKFAALMHRFESDNTIWPQPCPKLVEIVEHGQLGDHDLVMRTLHGYFDQYDLPTVDSVVLGCTHFVFYRDYFRELLPESTAIIDGNHGTVHHLDVILESLGALAPQTQDGSVTLTNSDPSPRVAQLAQALLDAPVRRVTVAPTGFPDIAHNT
ncbi:glutamate racemase [Bifidobacterium pseudolongum]|uniref:Glutamate racemase n=1 Tax=Bifidobacterium pseudolongum subsp. globosum TaxID=1690 RepID=A0A4Q5BE43_9BIFI|nr:glutamate racemase [Bifidobacterium pseudolongum]MCH4850220.1 glutamate racemase [Bifidobacterium pseudolongum]RYQ68714.1 glutamate racemase [Bifidobacterium pseudolongum subsp. globosum]RYQ71011.1 glutamate racemase [Bifidobacterium pseudolongum subsp. globosum]